MITSIELRGVEAFASLPDSQIEWFLSHVQDLPVKAGEAFVRQGDPAEWMFIFLEGQFQWIGEFGGDSVSLPVRAGEISGVFPFSRMKCFTVTGRALTSLLKTKTSQHLDVKFSLRPVLRYRSGVYGVPRSLGHSCRNWLVVIGGLLYMAYKAQVSEEQKVGAMAPDEQVSYRQERLDYWRNREIARQNRRAEKGIWAAQPTIHLSSLPNQR